MDILEVQEKKRILELSLVQLLSDFEVKTHTYIKNIEIERRMTTGKKSTIFDIHLEVGI